MAYRNADEVNSVRRTITGGLCLRRVGPSGNVVASAMLGSKEYNRLREFFESV